MRALAIATVVIAIPVLVAVAYLAMKRFGAWRRQHLESRARWIDVIRNHDGVTYVSVQQVADTIAGRIVLDEIHLGFVSHTSDDWNDRLRRLRLKAWDRAIDLNSQPMTE